MDEERGAPPPKRPSLWRVFAKGYVIGVVSILLTNYVVEFLGADHFLLRCGILALFMMFFDFLYQRYLSSTTNVDQHTGEKGKSSGDV